MFIAPFTALIAAAITVPALVALYFLKLRRREVVIPSTLLWRKAIQDLQVNAPFQRLRRNLLLLLQLLILGALLVAMARPTLRSAVQPGQRVAILIDHSASMNALDVDPTRLDEAKRAALELIDDLEGEGGAAAMVVSFADRARVVQPFTSDVTLLRRAVRNIEPTDQLSRLAPALQLIEPFALESEADGSKSLAVYVLSDGRVHQPADTRLALPGADLRFLRVGKGLGENEAVHNLAFTAFSARRDFERPEIVQVFARLANYSPTAVEANVELRLDGRVSRVERVALPAVSEAGPGREALQFDFVLPGSALVSVAHDFEDMLPADNVARLTLAPSRRLRVLLVGERNPFLERVIRSVGVRELVLMHPDKYEVQEPERLRRGGWDTAGTVASSEAGFDVIIFDGYSPEEVPPTDSLYFAAAPPIEGLALRTPQAEEPEAQVILDWQRDHPLMRYVVLDDVILGDSGRLAVPLDAQVLATGQRGPVMALVRRESVVHVVVSFDVLRTNWPMQVSFPVFVSNVVQTLGLGALAEQAGLAYAAGEVAVVSVGGDAAQVTYAGPVALEAPVERGQAVLPAFTRVGLYETEAEVEPPFDRLPVNLLDEVESDLRPAEQLEVGSSAVAGQARTSMIRREVWPWFVWAALAVLMVEWLVYTRRMHL